jgi:predicted DNA-binding transcriptional regulator YafY
MAAPRRRLATRQSRRGNYEVEPYYLLACHGNWYLLARNRAAARLETFALSRWS